MEDFFKEIIIKFGGPLPIIGGLLAVLAVAGAFIYKAWDTDHKPLAAGLIVFLLIVIGPSIPQMVSAYHSAQNVCRTYFFQNQTAYNDHNCILLWRPDQQQP
jgi:hypothetical protein